MFEHRGPQRLPRVVWLPTAPAMRAGAVQAALGNCSRQNVHWWRTYHNFPPPSGPRGSVETAALAAWLTAQGVQVRWP